MKVRYIYYIIYLILVQKNHETTNERIDNLEKKFDEFKSTDLKNEFQNLKKDFKNLSTTVQENKENINSLSDQLTITTNNCTENDENTKKKISTLKKHVDNKFIELNTKLELLLNNMGKTTDENGTVSKKFDLSGLNDFMQKLLQLENKFEDFSSSNKLDELSEKIKNLEENKLDKKDFEDYKELNKDLDTRIQKNSDDINEINQNIEKINQQINNINNENKHSKRKNNEQDKTDSEQKSLDISNLDLYLEKYVLKSNYEDFLKVNKEKINKIINELDNINNQIKEIKNILQNKANNEELSELREFLTNKLEEIINESTKKFSDKEDTSKYLKYLEEQIKNLYTSLKSKTDSHLPENWLLATKPITGFSCAACESYIGDLKTEKERYIPWNKLPTKEGGEKLYRMGNGFSKMLSMLNFDNTGNVFLNPNAESYNVENDDSKGESKKNDDKNLTTLLIRTKSQRDGLSLSNENSKPNLNMGKRTSNYFFKRDELKTSYLPKLKKDMTGDGTELKKTVEENPKIVKILKKSNSKINLKDNNKLI